MSRSKVYPLAAGIDRLLFAAEEGAAHLCRQPEGSDERRIGGELRQVLAELGVSPAEAKPYEPVAKPCEALFDSAESARAHNKAVSEWRRARYRFRYADLAAEAKGSHADAAPLIRYPELLVSTIRNALKISGVPAEAVEAAKVTVCGLANQEFVTVSVPAWPSRPIQPTPSQTPSSDTD